MSANPRVIAPDYVVLENKFALRQGFADGPRSALTFIEHRIVRTSDVTLLWLTHHVDFVALDSQSDQDPPREENSDTPVISSRMVHVVGFSAENSSDCDDGVIIASGRLAVHGYVRKFVADVADSMDEPAPFFAGVPDWDLVSQEEHDEENEEGEEDLAPRK